MNPKYLAVWTNLKLRYGLIGAGIVVHAVAVLLLMGIVDIDWVMNLIEAGN